MPSPRETIELSRVVINGFRAFPAQAALELGRVTVLCGPNGLGKTTVFDAIDWALFGDRWRLGEEGRACIHNLWHSSAPTVELGTTSGTLVRTPTTALIGGVTFRVGDLAVDPSVYDRAKDAALALRRLSYLPQHEIRQMIEGGEESRTFILAALAGVPFSERFARNLENTLDDIQSRLRSLDAEQSALDGRLAELKERVLAVRSAAERERQVVTELTAFLVVEPRLLADLMKPLEDALTLLATTEVNLRDRLRSVQGIRLRLEQVGTQLDETESRLQRLQVDEQAAAAASQAGEQRVRADTAERGRIAAVLAEDENHFARLTATRDALATEIQARMRLRGLRNREAAASANISVLGTRVSQLEATLQALANRLAIARQEQRQAFEGRAALMQQRESYERLEVERDSLRATSERMRRTRAEITEERAKAQGDLERSSNALAAEREKAGKAKRRTERLQSLIQELADLHDMNDGVCPVCSHDHGDAESLRSRIEKTISELRDSSARVRRIEEFEAAVKHSTALRNELERQYENVLAETRDAELAEQAATSRLELLAADIEKTDFAASMRRAETTEGIWRAAVKEHEDAGRVLDSAKDELDQWRRELAVVQALLKGDQQAGEHPPEDREAEQLAMLERELTVVRTRVDEGKADVAARDAALALMRSDERQDAERLAVARAAVQRGIGERDLLQQEATRLVGQASEIGIDGADRLAAFDNEVARLMSELATVEARSRKGLDLRKRAETLLNAVRSGEFERDLDDLTQRAASIDERRRVSERAAERLRSIGTHVKTAVEAELRRSQTRCRETIDAIMHILAPHRHLNGVVIGDRGEVLLCDDDLPNAVAAHLYSSAGQINCIALAVFLGIGLSTRSSRLRCLMLDEPVQNLDDVNLLNFLDLLRYVARSHQVILSTANANLAALLKVKLGPWAHAEKQRVVIHEFLDFGKTTGPEVRTLVSRASGQSRPGFEDVTSRAVLE